MNGAELIAAERQRQIDAEGYDAAHDTGHSDELAQAGAAYALAGYFRARSGPMTGENVGPFAWPWDLRFWKPTPHDRLRELVKAGALIAAAIDSIEDSK